MLITETISQLLNSELSTAAACEYVRHLGSVDPTADVLREAVQIIAKFADVEAVQAVQDIPGLMDCCGTGGSGLPHFNTSTAVAFVLAAAGVKVAKFGNRSSTSLSGSFDLLEALGLPCVLPPACFAEIVEETNLAFLFVQQFYPVLKKLVPIRQIVGARTLFNLVGPLLNPARPQFRLLGVPHRSEQRAIANYLEAENYCRRAFVVSSQAGLDELDPKDASTVLDVKQGSTREITIGPNVRQIGKPLAKLSTETNLRIFKAIVHNQMDEFSYYRALVCLNAGAGLYIVNKVQSVEEGLSRAEELISSGAVLDKFEQCRKVYERYTG
ncbi:MAG: anthranilate phosphoribosyltransferase [Candidatus Melainabacteria bacterium]|nr:MAG: anthranilate phosphoribosyltransferase [Candidatus Melainabacteria bacterium]